MVLPSGAKAKPKVMALSGHFDLPARASVLEQLTYNGHYSCCYCKEYGDVCKLGARSHVMTFPFRDTETGHAELRTMKSVEDDSYAALENDSIVSFGTYRHYNYIRYIICITRICSS